MKRVLSLLPAALLITALFCQASFARTLTVRWAKPESGNTNGGIQERELRLAVRELERNLRGQGIDVQLGLVKFTAEKPSGSNASPLGLWIGGKPVETLLNADVTGNPSSGMEIKVDGKAYRWLNADLIIKAGMSAAETMQAASPSQKHSVGKAG